MPINREDLRKVRYTRYGDGSGDFINMGYFHEFGQRKVPLDNGSYIQETYAIIELEDGTIKDVHPLCLKFVDDF